MQVDVLEKRLAREREARRQAEGLLERKSLELYEAHSALRQAYEQLEQRVVERTAELSEANRQLRNEMADRERAQRELQLAKEAAEAANRAKSEFLANMSHELRTPLNAVIGFSDVLMEQVFGPLNEHQAQYVADILESGQHLLSLVNDILDLAKIESGAEGLEACEVHLSTLVDRTFQMFRERAARKQIHLISSIDAEAEWIYADERKVKQLIINFLSNAVKFTPQGGAITVRGRRRGDQISISVADQGVGIAPEEQEKIFDMFYQVDSTLTKAKQGTGLGLALVRKVADLHHGRVWVESQVGVGSEFFFEFPQRLGAISKPSHPLGEGRPHPACGHLLP